MRDDTEGSFQVGLAMAGAISAGAYSAGVLDFLVQALDEWETARATYAEKGEPDDHRVILKVISGASAGAITGALGAVAMAESRAPLKFHELDAAYPGCGLAYPDPEQMTNADVAVYLPSLYETWVVRPAFVAPGKNPLDFLSIQDLVAAEKAKALQQKTVSTQGPIPEIAAVPSVLNSTLLDDIRNNALTPRGSPKTARAFVADPLHLYVTVSNLRGLPYEVGFSGGSYGMRSHGDRVHYKIQGVGSPTSTSKWADDDPAISLNVAHVFSHSPDTRLAFDQIPPGWQTYGNAALASGAFPIGLAPRMLAFPPSNFVNRSFPIAIMDGADFLRKTPEHPAGVPYPATASFSFINVDGGLINNEPFEFARFTLMKEPPRGNPRKPNEADRAVIMIDPFPDPPADVPDGRPKREIGSILAALFPTLVNQARFSLSDLVTALDDAVYSRYMIAPDRQLPDRNQKEKYPIACGVLGGFGGFLSRGFRDHDFQLGRRNCQLFLRDWFSLPDAAGAVANWPPTQDRGFAPAGGQGKAGEMPLIPLLETARTGVALPSWPQITNDDLTTLAGRIKGRLKEVAPRLIDAHVAGKWLGWALKVIAASKQGDLLDYVQLTIVSDLIRRDQLAGVAVPAPDEPELDAVAPQLPETPGGGGAGAPSTPQDRLATWDHRVRLVLGELASPEYTFRTLNGLAISTSLPQNVVKIILDKLMSAGRGDARVAETTWSKAPKSGTKLYTLARRTETGWRSWAVVRFVEGKFSPPRIDWA